MFSGRPRPASPTLSPHFTPRVTVRSSTVTCREEVGKRWSWMLKPHVGGEREGEKQGRGNCNLFKNI